VWTVYNAMESVPGERLEMRETDLMNGIVSPRPPFAWSISRKCRTARGHRAGAQRRAKEPHVVVPERQTPVRRAPLEALRAVVREAPARRSRSSGREGAGDPRPPVRPVLRRPRDPQMTAVARPSPWRQHQGREGRVRRQADSRAPIQEFRMGPGGRAGSAGAPLRDAMQEAGEDRGGRRGARRSRRRS